MTGRRTQVLIIGATGSIGRELTRLYAADGIQVHAVGRDRDGLAELASATGALSYPVDLADLQNTDDAVAALRDRQISLAIASVGGWYLAEPGLRLPMSRWTSTISSNLTAHFVAARAFAPVLSGRRPVYLALNGIASHHPCERSIAISVAGAGQRMMLDVLAAEERAQPTRFAELVIDTPVLLPGERSDHGEPTHTVGQVYQAIGALVDEDPGHFEDGSVLRRHLG